MTLTPMPTRMLWSKAPVAWGVALAIAQSAHGQLLLDRGGQWGRVGAGVDGDGRARGELLLRLTPNERSRVLFEAHGGEAQSLGLKLSYHIAPQRGPLRGTLKTFVALDRNTTRDRKVTVGIGAEANDLFWGFYGSRSASDARLTPSAIGGSLETLPYDWGVGLRAGTFFDSALMRITLGADYEKGKQGARQTSASLLAEKYFSDSPVSVALNLEALSRRSELQAKSDDLRAGMSIRVDLGGPRNLVSTGPSLARSLDNPLTHKQSVDVYQRRSNAAAAVGNLSPIASDDSQSFQNAGAEVLIDVLANDRDPNGDTLMLTAVGAAQHGTTRTINGKVGYTPTAGYVGADAFSYTITDGKGGSATGMVRVSVSAAPGPTPAPTPTPTPTPTAAPNRAPEAVADNFTVNAGSSNNPLDVLANDRDADNDPLTLASVSTPGNGTATVAGRLVVYTPRAGFSGADSFTYSVSDGKGGTAIGNVTISVSPTPAPTPTPTPSPSPTPAPGGNLPPVANPDMFTVNCSGSTSFNVLTNDSDPNPGDTIFVIGFTFPPATLGQLIFVGDGRFTFTGNGTIFSSTAFEYTLSDDKNATSKGTVTLRCQT